MKKFLSIAVASLLAASALVGCGGQGTSSQGGSSSSTPSEDSFKTSSAITVITPATKISAKPTAVNV